MGTASLERPDAAPAEGRAPGRRVLITGVGAVSPLGVGAPALIDRWIAGESGIEDWLARCSDFEPTETLSRKEARRMDRFTQFAVVAAD